MQPTSAKGYPRVAAKALGPDREEERDRQAVAKIRARGRIRSEREYRIVQAYADGIPADPGDEEYLALGAMLDEYMAAPEPPDNR